MSNDSDTVPASRTTRDLLFVPLDLVRGFLIGSAELIASALLLITATRRLGALLGLGIISGAIFFHLFTPLGINRTIDAAGNTDGGALFFMACGVWLSCALILWVTTKEPTS